MTTVITTFSKDGYELYGHRMVSSWIRYWPETFNLIVYTEDYELEEQDSRIVSLDINQSCPNLKKFKNKSFEKINEQSNNKRWIRRIEKTIKWCHKVYITSHALRNLKTDYLIYLDGDTWTNDTISDTIARDLIGDQLLGVHFETLSFGLHFETGIIVFNNNHEQKDLLSKIYQSGYDDLTIYDLEKTWDTFWLMHLWKTYNLDIKDLAENKESYIFGNPLIYNKIKHNVGTKKYSQAGYNKFTGKKKI